MFQTRPDQVRIIPMVTSKRKAHLIIITAFILGVAVGASGQYLLTHQKPSRPASSATGAAGAADELTRILKLDQSQRLQVIQILGECQKQNQDLKDQTRPQFQAIRETGRNRIRAILSPEQLVLYNQWIRDLDAKREKRASEEGKQINK
jgi:hypothetical protein